MLIVLPEAVMVSSLQAEVPGVVTLTVTATPLPEVLAPFMVMALVIAISEAIVIVSLPADKLKVMLPPSVTSVIACLRLPAPELALVVTT